MIVIQKVYSIERHLLCFSGNVFMYNNNKKRAFKGELKIKIKRTYAATDYCVLFL